MGTRIHVFPKMSLLKALGLDTAKTELTLLHSYTRTEVLGGYHTHLHLPRQQWPAIAAGSVFVFELKQKCEKACEETSEELKQDTLLTPEQNALFGETETETPPPEPEPAPETASDKTSDILDEKHRIKLEQAGLGLRRGEGYGRIAVNRLDSLYLTGSDEKCLDDSTNQREPDVSGTKIPKVIQELLQNVIRSRCLAEMKRKAITIANQIPKEDIPSNSLIGRLRLFLSHDTPATSLEKLREPAKEKLGKYKINMHDIIPPLSNEMALYDLFKKAWTEPQSFAQGLIEGHVSELVEARYGDTRQMLIETLVKNDSAILCTDFLDYLLTMLHRRSKI